MATVRELLIYPVKGARPVAVQSVEIDAGGLKGDRLFAVMRDGARCNVKQIPAILFLSAEWQGRHLVLSYPERDDFALDTDAPGSALTEAFRGGETPLSDMGDAVANWLSLALGETVRLGRISEPSPFIIPLPEFGAVHGQTQERFVDAAPIMLASTASLDDLNQRLQEPVEMGRFRPNIVLDGLPAYGEDAMSSFRFEKVELAAVAPCERCTVVTMDLRSGETGKEPLATLATYRRRENHYAGGVMFGSYLSVSTPGRLSVGEALH